MNDLERRLVSWVDLLGALNFSMQSLTNLLRNGRAIDLGGRHGDWRAREISSLSSVSWLKKKGRSSRGGVESC